MTTLLSMAAHTPTELHTRVRRFTRRRCSLLTLLAELDATLSAEHATGQLIIHYTQGTAPVLEFHERHGAQVHPITQEGN
jgi:hypothetical protein